jgi:drug/metabolite transporter (DMT)-like permease
MQALAEAPPGNSAAGLVLATLAAVLFAVGAVLQHEAAERSRTASGLSLRRLVTRRRWIVGQCATVLGTAAQVGALAVAPVAVVQPMLSVALVVALGLRAVRTRQAPLRLELLGAVLTTCGLAVFLLAAQPAARPSEPPPAVLAVVGAIVLSIVLVAATTLLGHGAHGAVACGAAAGIAAGIAAVLISVGLRSLQEGGWVHAMAGVALWGALVVAVVAILGGQHAYARGHLHWSLPALILLDPLAAVPAARLLLGERLEPGHAGIWIPAAVVAAIGVVVLARTGEPHEVTDAHPPAAGAGSRERGAP